MKKRSLLPGFLLVCFLQSMSAVDIAAQTVLTSECNVKQRTHYYPFGGIIPEYSTYQSAQPYKFNGKELDRMHGLDWYDYGARNYDAILARWDRIDPLCEKYYHISPYVYCAGNPIFFIDKDGRKFDYSSLTEEEYEKYIKSIEDLISNSELFQSLYTTLASSTNIYKVEFGKLRQGRNRDEIKNGQFKPNVEGGGTLTFSSEVISMPESVYSEELFHAFQNENRSNHSSDKPFNLEFEAKVFSIMVGLQSGGIGEFDGMRQFQNSIMNTPENKYVELLGFEYLLHANDFAKYYLFKNVNSNYKIPTKTRPYNLIKILSLTK